LVNKNELTENLHESFILSNETIFGLSHFVWENILNLTQPLAHPAGAPLSQVVQ